MTSKVPPILSPYIELPPHGSLTLLTGVLNTNANWLVLRYLYASLQSGARSKNASNVSKPEAAGVSRQTDGAKVVMISWMRDFDFWKTEARRAVGLDLAKLREQNHFAFVDGLTNLFSSSADAGSSPSSASKVAESRTGVAERAPARFGTHPPSIEDRAASQSPAQPSQPNSYALSSPTLAHLSNTILSALSTLEQGSTHTSKIILILDAPSILLQTTAPPITSTGLSNALLKIRSRFHATIMSLPADAALLSPAASLASGSGYAGNNATIMPTPLEVENAAFVVSMAHQARCLLSCRGLATGFAKDVSGVVRVTRGSYADDFDILREGDGNEKQDSRAAHGSERSEKGGLMEGEWLFYISADGNVKVWSRGSGMDAG